MSGKVDSKPKAAPSRPASKAPSRKSESAPAKDKSVEGKVAPKDRAEISREASQKESKPSDNSKQISALQDNFGEKPAASKGRSLSDDRSVSGGENCLDRAASQARNDDQALFLKDGQNKDGNDAGHVVLQRDGRIVDPNTPDKNYENFEAYKAANPQYSEILGQTSGENLKRIVDAQSPAEREQAIQQAGLENLKNERFADAADEKKPAVPAPGPLPASSSSSSSPTIQAPSPASPSASPTRTEVPGTRTTPQPDPVPTVDNDPKPAVPTGPIRPADPSSTASASVPVPSQAPPPQPATAAPVTLAESAGLNPARDAWAQARNERETLERRGYTELLQINSPNTEAPGQLKLTPAQQDEYMQKLKGQNPEVYAREQAAVDGYADKLQALDTRLQASGPVDRESALSLLDGYSSTKTGDFTATHRGADAYNFANRVLSDTSAPLYQTYEQSGKLDELRQLRDRALPSAYTGLMLEHNGNADAVFDNLLKSPGAKENADLKDVGAKEFENGLLAIKNLQTDPATGAFGRAQSVMGSVGTNGLKAVAALAGYQAAQAAGEEGDYNAQLKYTLSSTSGGLEVAGEILKGAQTLKTGTQSGQLAAAGQVAGRLAGGLGIAAGAVSAYGNVSELMSKGVNGETAPKLVSLAGDAISVVAGVGALAGSAWAGPVGLVGAGIGLLGTLYENDVAQQGMNREKEGILRSMGFHGYDAEELSLRGTRFEQHPPGGSKLDQNLVRQMAHGAPLKDGSHLNGEGLDGLLSMAERMGIPQQNWTTLAQRVAARADSNEEIYAVWRAMQMADNDPQASPSKRWDLLRERFPGIQLNDLQPET